MMIDSKTSDWKNSFFIQEYSKMKFNLLQTWSLLKSAIEAGTIPSRNGRLYSDTYINFWSEHEPPIHAEHQSKLIRKADFLKWAIEKGYTLPDFLQPKRLEPQEVTDINEFILDRKKVTIVFNGNRISIPRRAGHEYIRELLRNKFNEIKCTELSPGIGGVLGNDTEVSNTQRQSFDDKSDENSYNYEHDNPSHLNMKLSKKKRNYSENMMDDRYRKEVEENIERLVKEISNPTLTPEKRMEKEEELKKLKRIYNNSKFKGGKTRHIDPESEQARKRVANAIKRAIEELKSFYSVLYEHFKDSIRTGYTCRYVPQPDISWSV